MRILPWPYPARRGRQADRVLWDLERWSPLGSRPPGSVPESRGCDGRQDEHGYLPDELANFSAMTTNVQGIRASSGPLIRLSLSPQLAGHPFQQVPCPVTG